MFTVFSCLCYFVVGAILSLPYCLLAGWDRDIFLGVMIVTPFLLGVWILAAVFARIIDAKPIRIYWKNAFRRSRGESSHVPMVIFWIWTVYSLLPIILHWTARLIGHYRNGPFVALIEAHRFESLIYVFWGFMIAFLLLIVCGGVYEAVAEFLDSRKTAPPNDD